VTRRSARTAPRHDRREVPGCQACADPDALANWLADQRILAAELAEHAKHLRVAGDDARQRYNATPAADVKAFKAAQNEMLGLYGEANAAAQHALIISADADRVEAAHPQVVGS
jgi:hypothetical protein